jgi:serine/threonine-protein kinase HipA
MTDRISLFLDQGTAGPRAVGEAYFSSRAGQLLSTVVSYDSAYIADPAGFPVSPSLPLVTGGQHVNGLPGFLSDCAPDRWGRNLITRQHRARARADGQSVSTLTDVDFLIGVSDITRQGAIRLTCESEGPFVAAGSDVPKMLDLPRLLHAADLATSDDDLAAIKELLDAGSGSLGGARPKASVRDGDQLFIAKFPHQHDDWDVMAWEKLTLDLAAAAGINVPENRVTQVDGRTVLLLERFDRIAREGTHTKPNTSVRVPYISAMTVLDAHDGETHDYLELAETLPEISASTRADLRQMWRRIAFSVMVNNTDDHLRNHGFLRARGGWRLSPAFDINPSPDAGSQRVTGIGGARTRTDAIEALREHASSFDMSDSDAVDVLDEVSGVIHQWRTRAERLRIPSREMQLMSDAFWTP